MPNGIAADLLPGIGVLVSIGLITVSILLNARMAYRSADTLIDAWIYATAAGLADALKAYAPFAAHAGYRNRDWVAVAAAIAVFTAITAFTFTNEFGFALLHRTERQAARASHTEHRGDLRQRADAYRRVLSSVGPTRAPAEIDADIGARQAAVIKERARTVADLSRGCTIDRRETREACAAIATLVQERATAERAAGLEEALRDIEQRLATSPLHSGRDPQSDGLQQLAPWMSASGMDTALSLLVALTIELGSGLGLYIATTPWRTNASVARQLASPPPRAPLWMRFGDVTSYAAVRLTPSPQAVLALAEAYQDYQSWCRNRHCKPYTARIWSEHMATLAGDLGITVRRNGVQLELLGVALVPSALAQVSDDKGSVEGGNPALSP